MKFAGKFKKGETFTDRESGKLYVAVEDSLYYTNGMEGAPSGWIVSAVLAPEPVVLTPEQLTPGTRVVNAMNGKHGTVVGLKNVLGDWKVEFQSDTWHRPALECIEAFVLEA